jgi:protein SCO1/2
MVVRKILFRVLIIIVPLSLGIFFSIYINQGHGSLEDVSATVLRDAKPLPKFVLEDHFGNGFTNKNLKNQWSLVFFGYTHCPDICPTTLALLNQVDQVLKKESDIDKPRIIFISVDPERDTIEQLTDYVTYFNPEFIGVTGSMENLQVLTKSLGIVFGKEGDDESNDYEVYHTARILLVDPKARLKALFSSPHDVNQIASDYIKIIDS